MSKSHSRRAVLAGIATTPALTAPALATDTTADAQLIELGRQWDDLESKLETAFELSGPNHEAQAIAIQELDARFGADHI
jgi:hypothetical protein